MEHREVIDMKIKHLNHRKSKRYQANSKKQYLRKIRIYPYFLYMYLDKWLQDMSSKGWHIIHCGMFSFWFEKGDPKNKEYFTYGCYTHEGKYSFELRYPFLEKTYGMKEKKSKINSNKNKTHTIIEIDLNRIDIENNVGYKEMISDRNRLYLKLFIRDVSIILLPIFAYIVLKVI